MIALNTMGTIISGKQSFNDKNINKQLCVFIFDENGQELDLNEINVSSEEDSSRPIFIIN